MEISRTDLIANGDQRRFVYDSLTIVVVTAGLFAAFAWSIGPNFGPQYLNTPLVKGAAIFLLSLLLMISVSD